MFDRVQDDGVRTLSVVPITAAGDGGGYQDQPGAGGPHGVGGLHTGPGCGDGLCLVPVCLDQSQWRQAVRHPGERRELGVCRGPQDCHHGGHPDLQDHRDQRHQGGLGHLDVSRPGGRGFPDSQEICKCRGRHGGSCDAVLE